MGVLQFLFEFALITPWVGETPGHCTQSPARLDSVARVWLEPGTEGGLCVWPYSTNKRGNIRLGTNDGRSDETKVTNCRLPYNPHIKASVKIEGLSRRGHAAK